MKAYIELNDNGTLKKANGVLTVRELKEKGMFGEKEQDSKQ